MSEFAGTARLATSLDSESVLALWQSYAQEFKGARGEAELRQNIYDLSPVTIAQDLEDSNCFVVVGEFADTVLGFAIVKVEGEVATVSHLVVVKVARGVGIGAAMAKLLIEELGKTQAKRVNSFVLPGARGSKNFFEAFGMKAKLITVGKEL